jgi:tetratricopeptide (TPR) repeat protein
MGTIKHSRRRIALRWALGLLAAGIVVAETKPPAALSKPAPAPPGARPDPDIRNEKAQRLDDEIAESLEHRFRSRPKLKGDVLESENVLTRPAPKVVVDEVKPWRDRMESALKKYELETDPKEHKMAEDLLIGIVLSPDAPEEIQRECLMHLAQIALNGKFYSRAQMIYSQLVDRFPLSPEAPSVLYRQGILYRRMGATELALSKLHAVMSTVLSLPEKDVSSYKTIVLQAQTEIADTFFMAGQFERATEYFKRVLKLANEDLNEAQVRLKLVKSYFELKDWKNVITEGQLCIEKVALSSQIAEVRFLMTEAYKQLGMQREAVEQTMALLNSEQARSAKDPDTWAYWQKRTGNRLANELYEKGDYLNALLIYQTLWQLPGDETWKSQALYQMGLIYERLEQPERAIDAYTRILGPAANGSSGNPAPSASGATNAPANTAAKAQTNASNAVPPTTAPQATNLMTADRGNSLSPTSIPRIVEDKPAIPPSLKLLREMAQWRMNNLQWDQNVTKEIRNLSLKPGASSGNTESTAAPSPQASGGKTPLP